MTMRIDEFVNLDLNTGYVAMDRDGEWNWFEEKPYKDESAGVWDSDIICSISSILYIEPVEDWELSLRKVG